MARRTREETEALRAEIVQTALRYFAEHGYDATAIGSIAKAVGISKQALMHHFKTKEVLRDAILDKVKHTFDEVLPKVVRAFAAPESELDLILDELLTAMDEHAAINALLLRRAAFSPWEDVPDSGSAVAELLKEYLRRGKRGGTVRPEVDPDTTLFCLGLMFLTSQTVSAKARADGSAGLDRERRLAVQRELVRITRLAVLRPEALDLHSLPPEMG